MDIPRAAIKVRERFKLLAWEDSAISAPVLVDLTFAGHTHDLESLSRHINLADLIEAVRRANEKLPRDIVVKGPEEGDTGSEDGEEIETNPFKFSEMLQDKRYVLPSELESLVQDDLFKKDNLSNLRNLMIGRGDGKPLAKMGMLGRAANEENSGTSDAPFYYATVLQLLRFLSERAYGQLLNEGRVAGANDDLRSMFQTWTGGLAGKIRHTAIVERLLSNPLAPYALRRQPRPVSIIEAEKQYLSVAPNAYRLSYEVARELDLFMEKEHGGGEPEEKAESALTKFEHAVEFRADELRAAKKYRKYSFRIASTAGAAAPAMYLFLPWDSGLIASRIFSPDFVGTLITGLAIFGAIWFTGIMASGLVRTARRRKSEAWKDYLDIRAKMSGQPGLATALARAVALSKLVRAVAKKGHVRFNAGLADAAVVVKTWKKSGRKLRALLRRAQEAIKPLSREWLVEIPSIMAGYRKLKADEADYAHISALTPPPIDFSDGYQPLELKEMWLQNACVCYGEEFSTLIIGKAATASVYFMDVTGSTELSTKGNLSNALAIYSRLLTYVNETGIRPLWRKEMGDGRFYCHPNHDALKRAVMTAQGCASPAVGVGVGIGFSVGEIYTDVRTGDFQNEVTNRASRLNARDDIAGSWISARYAHHPLKVHVKFGKLFNRGIAMDEKALNAFGVPHDEAVRTMPPFEWKFPVMTEQNGKHILGSVSFMVARINPGDAIAKLATLGKAEHFSPVLHHPEKLKAFEVFCHLTPSDLHYTSPEGKDESTAYLSSLGAQNAKFQEGEAEMEIPVVHKPINLPTGETVMVIVKREKTHLRGLGYTAIAEVDIPAVTLRDPAINISEFLSKA